MTRSEVTFVTVLLTLTATANYGIRQSLGVHGEEPEEYGDYFEGDMIIDYEPVLTPSSGRVRRSALISPERHWKNATVPYAFASHYRLPLRNVFEKAINYMSSKTCLRFIPRTTEKDYIYIMSGLGCYSFVGRQGGGQPVSLPDYCVTSEEGLAVAVHEIMHSLGFIHEQSRPDRDKYVKINWENIRPGIEDNFESYGSNVVSGFGVGYDYDSVMHYTRFQGSKSGKPTIEPIGGPNVVIGQRKGMSKGDIEKISNMYCKSNEI